MFNIYKDKIIVFFQLFKIVFILQMISTIYLEKYELKTELIYANDTWGAYDTLTQKWNGAIALV